MPFARTLVEFAFVSAIGCARSQDGPAIPSPGTALVRDGGSVIRAPLRPASGCPATQDRSNLGPGTLHGATIDGRETWTREGSPHRVPNGVHITAGGVLRISPCAVVLVGANGEIVVQDDARLIAAGTPAEPIVFDSLAERPSPGDWIGVELRAHALPRTRFVYAALRNAGAPPPLRGEPAAGIRSRSLAGLEVDHASVEASAGYGVALLDLAGFSGNSTELTVRGATGAGTLYVDDVDQVRSLPAVVLHENSVNDVFVAAHARVVRSDGTWRSLGADARYRIRNSTRIMVQGDGAPVLTLAPAVTIAFEGDAELDVGWDAPGALFADGGDERGTIVFTSEGGASGASRWVGVLFGERADTARSRLRYTRIEGAGARATGDFDTCPLAGGARLEPSGMLFFQGVRGTGLVTNTEFRRGPPDGVAILLAGDSPVGVDDFTASSRGNIFVRAAVRCAQSTPPVSGRCPPTPRCDVGNPDASSRASARVER